MFSLTNTQIDYKFEVKLAKHVVFEVDLKCLAQHKGIILKKPKRV